MKTLFIILLMPALLTDPGDKQDGCISTFMVGGLSHITWGDPQTSISIRNHCACDMVVDVTVKTVSGWDNKFHAIWGSPFRVYLSGWEIEYVTSVPDGFDYIRTSYSIVEDCED